MKTKLFRVLLIIFTLGVVAGISISAQESQNKDETKKEEKKDKGGCCG
ncbi:MAG: hypothetical protein WCK76_12005 [Elusimicrobiota bacterium]